MLPNATVCRICGGVADDLGRRIDYDRPLAYEQPTVATAVQVSLDELVPAYLRPNPERLSTILSCWPFGAADPSDGPATAISIEATRPAARDEPETRLGNVPAQRVPTNSVPAADSDPFLLPAWMLYLQKEAAAN
jgi:hypothetical protein